MSQTLDAVLQKGQTMPEKNRFPAVLQPVVIDRAAFNQGENAQYDPHIGEADVMDTVVARGPHANGVRDAGASIPFRKSKRAQSETDDESWVEGQQSNTLNNFDVGDTRTTHAVVEPVAWTQNQRDEVRLLGDKAAALALPGTHQTNYIAEPKLYENHPNDSRVTGPLNVAPTVVSRFGTGGGNVPLVNPEAITFQPGNLCRQAGAEPSTTTTTTLKASMGDQMPHVAQAMAVRRLTPNECLRLQGFPDNHTNIPWKGKPEGQAPDGPQYKCAGNSFAVPVVRWIGTRIAAQP